ncbi:MAG: hypothetical protein ACRD2W_21930 [Acidimicrobiales bacterium]
MRTYRRILTGLIVLILAGDAVAVVALREDAMAARRTAPPGPSTTAPTTTTSTMTIRPWILLRDDFGSASAYRSSDSETAEVTTSDGQHRMRFKRSRDVYSVLPAEAPERARIEATQNVSVAVEARHLSGAPDDWFGVFCRYHGLDGDTYLGMVVADGSWGIFRVTLGSQRGPYGLRPFVRGREPGFTGTPSPDTVFRIRLDCAGDTLTALRLYLNGKEIGRASDTAGVGPGNIGFAASSGTGELAFDNLVVAEFS